MENKISISFPFESKEEFEDRQKKLIREIFDEKLSVLSQKRLTNDYGTRKEVALKLHLSLPTLHSLTKSGTIKGYKISGRVLYRWSEVDEALTQIESIKYKRGQ